MTDRLKLIIWSALLMVALISATAWVILRTQDRITESTLSATAQTTAHTWYQHFFNYLHVADDLAQRLDTRELRLAQMKHAEAFGNVYHFNLFDTDGRLIFSRDRPESQDAFFHHGTQPPPSTGGRAIAKTAPLANSDDPAVQKIVQQVLHSGEIVTRVSAGWKSKDPSRHFAVSFIPITEGGQILGVAEIFVDIVADRKTIYNSFHFFGWTLTLILTLASLVPITAISYSWLRISAMNRDLAAARDRAQAAENVKARFLANMSHEIRTPLTGVMGMAELLSETDLDDEQKRFAETILNSSSALLTIINDILDFSKIEAGKLVIMSEPFDLHDCVQDAADLLFPTGYNKGVELCVDFQKDLPAYVIGDEWRLRQCLLNIAGNAVKFTKTGHVTIRVTEKPAGFFEISVCDTGIGIAPDKLETIFQEFEQVENSDARSNDGTGLGLAITRKLLRLMGGEITVQSELGIGSCFRMTLPLKPASPEQQKQAEKPPLFLDPAALRGKTAMLVDDLDINRRILTSRLESFGMKSTAFPSADAALTALRAQGGDAFDVIVSDHQMPGKTGIDLLKAVRASQALRDIPFIILSSCDLGQLRNELGDSPVDLYLNKPVRTDMLYKGLCRAMQLAHCKPCSAGAQRQGSDGPSSPVRVGVAEDNKTNRLIIEKMLAGCISDLHSWNNGQEAVDGFLAARPHLIFMDISMPVKSGLTAATEIRELERQHGLAPCFIVALTAHAMAEDKDRARLAGMDGFLTKPIRKAELIGFVDDVARRLRDTPDHNPTLNAPRRA